MLLRAGGKLEVVSVPLAFRDCPGVPIPWRNKNLNSRIQNDSGNLQTAPVVSESDDSSPVRETTYPDMAAGC